MEMVTSTHEESQLKCNKSVNLGLTTAVYAKVLCKDNTIFELYLTFFFPLHRPFECSFPLLPAYVEPFFAGLTMLKENALALSYYNTCLSGLKVWDPSVLTRFRFTLSTFEFEN